MGYRIPRNDSANDQTKYAVIILTLFKVWSDTKTSPLKSPETDWCDAFDEFKLSMSPEHARTMLNMQLLYQTRDTKFDYAAKRAKRLSQLTAMARNAGIADESNAESEYDPIWENVMQTATDPEHLEANNVLLTKDTWATRDAQQITARAKDVGFYSVLNLPNTETCANFGKRTRLGNEDDIYQANEIF